jgi:hypothetical protein
MRNSPFKLASAILLFVSIASITILNNITAPGSNCTIPGDNQFAGSALGRAASCMLAAQLGWVLNLAIISFVLLVISLVLFLIGRERHESGNKLILYSFLACIATIALKVIYVHIRP